MLSILSRGVRSRSPLEQIAVDGIAVGDPINRVNLLYFTGVDRIHRIVRTRHVGSIDPDPV